MAMLGEQATSAMIATSTSVRAAHTGGNMRP